MARSKYNVDTDDKKKRSFDGILFDSVLEMKYYRDVVCPLVESGEIVEVELQKSYELQPKFTHDGKTVRAITYVADFYLVYKNGDIEVVDTKGCPDNLAKMKRKMLWYHYPTLTYKWITYVKKYGGWVEYDTVNKLRKEEKRRKKEEVNNGKEE